MDINVLAFLTLIISFAYISAEDALHTSTLPLGPIEDGQGFPRQPKPKRFTFKRSSSLTRDLPIPTYISAKKHNNVIISQATSPSFVSGSSSESCDNVHLREHYGTIRTPGYPRLSNTSFCSWLITGRLNDTITISFDDIDLTKSPNEICSFNGNHSDITQPCCLKASVIITEAGNQRIYCGTDEEKKLMVPFVSESSQVTIKFVSSLPYNSNRGIHLTYFIGPQFSPKCKSNQFRCNNGKCIPKAWKCNRKDECNDGSDEADCDDLCTSVREVRCDANGDRDIPGCYSFPLQRCDGVWDCENGADEKGCQGCPSDMFACPTGGNCFSEAKRCDANADCIDFADELNCGFCGPNKTQCNPSSLTNCYNPLTQRCNHVFDCVGAEDEKGCLDEMNVRIHGCENKILCTSGNGCFSSEERCNGIPDCSDYSDERNCTLEICRADHGSFLCGDGKCIRAAWLCDRSRDCDDATDEMNCLKNSVITAAIMGSLICGLLLVIAISCTCKLIALRQVEQHHLSDSLVDPRIVQGCARRGHLPFSLGGGGGETDSSLFRLEHEFFYREPPPSYAVAMGTPCEVPHERDRQCRRQRRSQRRQRRRPPSPPPAHEELSDQSLVNSILGPRTVTLGQSSNPLPVSGSHDRAADATSNRSTPDDKDEVKPLDDVELVHDCPTEHQSNSSSSNAQLNRNSVNIELDSIPSPSQTDCDEQPLLS
ncbi:Low-density lipoprotein receptor-related protein 3 [Halotydeus destructor]|nr:Low-density lipoprotein receptor-related protein 3 [Halotydeus destructor]